MSNEFREKVKHVAPHAFLMESGLREKVYAGIYFFSGEVYDIIYFWETYGKESNGPERVMSVEKALGMRGCERG